MDKETKIILTSNNTSRKQKPKYRFGVIIDESLPDDTIKVPESYLSIFTDKYVIYRYPITSISQIIKVSDIFISDEYSDSDQRIYVSQNIGIQLGIDFLLDVVFVESTAPN